MNDIWAGFVRGDTWPVSQIAAEKAPSAAGSADCYTCSITPAQLGLVRLHISLTNPSQKTSYREAHLIVLHVCELGCFASLCSNLTGISQGSNTRKFKV